jgi:hypothetical protein
MQSNEPANPAPRTGISTHIVEAVVAACVVTMGLVVIFGSRALGSGWTSDGPGSGYFPFWIGVILCIAGVGTLYQAFSRKTRNTAVFVDGEQLKRVLSVLIPAVIYVGFVQLVGLYLASTVYIAGFMVLLGKYSWIKSTIVAVSIMVLFFFMFEVWFKVPLFKGQFNPLGFLGY